MESDLKSESSLKNQNLELVNIEPPHDEEEEESEKDEQPLLKPDSNGTSSSSTSNTTTTTSSSSSTRVSISSENLHELEKKYAAYVRNDVYGIMGRGELGLEEKFLVGLGLLVLLPIRVILAFTILVLYYFICRLCTIFKVPNGEDEQEDFAHLVGWRRNVIVGCGRFLSRVILFIFGFYWISETYRNYQAVEKLGNENESKEQAEEPERPGAIISNHISYLDILYHMSSSFPSFVAKRSVAKLPLVGLISKCLGCVYVQRESRSAEFKGVSGVVTERVLEAHRSKDAPPMMLFPEGTTTNGDYLLPFKTGAFLAKTPVLPVLIRYPYRRFSPAWDSISGARHVILLLCQFVNHIEVVHLPVYYPSEQEQEDPKLYANNVRKLLASEGNLTLTDIGLAEKRIYHAALNGFFDQS